MLNKKCIFKLIASQHLLKDFQTETVYGKDYLKGTTYYYPRHFKIYPWTLPNWRKTVYPDGSVLTPLPYPIASAEMLF